MIDNEQLTIIMTRYEDANNLNLKADRAVRIALSSIPGLVDEVKKLQKENLELLDRIMG